MTGVRPARDTDVPAVESLQRLVSHPSPDLLGAWPAVGTLLVAVDADDRPVGYLLAVGAHLTELAVSPDHRREGRATALVEAYRDSRPASDAPLTLLVHPENDGARACYEALGFRRDARIPDAFDGDDGLRFVLESSEG
ncbi:GNAT family N-acetyltransferase [Haloferax sp. Atlit-10N]|uniref:Peptide N-acetyltransferase n=1 Tax=Haloferax prahovense (strain DSM 18310 / JCM 13924 / TL6) TaxID=1227461 RepID=M0G499_HALPT|nr:MULTISPECIES: GNAT family N-acetyltransferase [Haloferax]ELZ66413.1 peptide N-acetyltransferase [Haloferax prahovense DSM 18310]RDZ44698.1 GNAT family N-acetyltransferase [Haloferax sp. Atlit-16N]RDZ48048.1 GNAT family N-acetyltransferase [Haloferax sp. Atlit-19N]RDZ59522.1 GNAT family N-acetyltransferase [Haloferax sp. Atlit-10N]